MVRISGQIEIDASRERVWDILADLGGVKQYHPGLRDSHYHPGETRGVGASRHCDLKPFGSLEETAIAWHEGESYTLEIHDARKAPPFRKAIGTLAVREQGTGTVVSMTLEYELKYGPVGRLMDRLMVRPQFEKVVPAVLGGLKRFAESQGVAQLNHSLN